MYVFVYYFFPKKNNNFFIRPNIHHRFRNTDTAIYNTASYNQGSAFRAS